MSTVFLIPTVLAEDGLSAIPPYVTDAIKTCDAFFVEEERTARRYLKRLWKEMIIDNYKWVAIQKAEQSVVREFQQCLQEGKTIGIISEAGCPGIADPGQILVGVAQRSGAIVKPLVGPSSILLALIASGLNGQQFQFVGYLPIDSSERLKAIKQLEEESQRKNCTQIFIETPYRNNQMLETLSKNCKNSTRICVAANLTAANETILTKTAAEWKNTGYNFHKQPAIFCFLA